MSKFVTGTKSYDERLEAAWDRDDIDIARDVVADMEAEVKRLQDLADKRAETISAMADYEAELQAEVARLRAELELINRDSDICEVCKDRMATIINAGTMERKEAVRPEADRRGRCGGVRSWPQKEQGE